MHFKKRKSEKTKTVWTTLISTGVIVLMIAGFTEKAFSRNGRAVQSSPATSPKGTPIPPVIHPVVPPQFINKWTIADVVNSFQRNQIEIVNIKPVTEANYSSLPTMAKEGIKFSIPSVRGDVAGCIFNFENKYDLEKVRKHYLTLNESGELYTWSFVKDNILLVLEGRLLQEADREFENILDEFG